MILLFVLRGLMVAAAVIIATKLSLPAALAVWAAVTAVVCITGAIQLQLQPVGISTTSGRIGGSFVYWGFRAGQGQLIPATVISWLVWLLLGAAIIGLTQFRSQPRHVLMILAWTVDVASLFYVLGVLGANRGSSGGLPSTLLMLSTVLLVMIAGSAVLWWYVGTERARMAALALAGGPPLVIGVGYGFFMAVTLIGARGKWN